MNRKKTPPIRGTEFRLGNAVIWSRAFRVEHSAIQSYPKCGIAIWSDVIYFRFLENARLEYIKTQKFQWGKISDFFLSEY